MKIKSFVRFLMVLLACVSYSHGVFAQMLSEFCNAQNANDLHDYRDLKNYSCGDEREPEKAWITCVNGTAIKYICGQCNFDDDKVGIFIDSDENRICSFIVDNDIPVISEDNYKRIDCNDGSSGKGVYYNNTLIKCGQCSGQNLTYMAPNTESGTSDYDIYEIGRCVNCSDFNSSGYGLDSSGHCSKCSLLQDGHCVESCSEGYVANNGVCETCPSGGYEYNGTCYDTCPTGTKVADSRDLNYCTTCPSQYVSNNICVDTCPSGTKPVRGDFGSYCDDCPSNKPYSYSDECYADCPDGTSTQTNSSSGKKFCGSCGSNISLALYDFVDGVKTKVAQICVARSSNNSSSGTKCGVNDGLDAFTDEGNKCVPKCTGRSCTRDFDNDCGNNKGLKLVNDLHYKNTQNEPYVADHYTCLNCDNDEILLSAEEAYNTGYITTNTGYSQCIKASEVTACPAGKVKFTKNGVTDCYTCDALNMQSGCTTSGGIFTQGKPKSGYYFEGGDSGRSKEPKFCQYKETDNPKKCWINDNSSDGNNNCVNCDTSKLIKTFDDYGPDRLYAVNTTDTCPAGTYIYNSECVACTGTLSNGEYKGVTADGQCGSCGDNAFVAFTCDGKGTTLYPSCNGGTITGQQCVSKTDTMFSELIGKTDFEDYKKRGFLYNTTNTIQLCNLSVFHPTCTTGVCINGDSDGVYGVGIEGTGVTRTCEKCGEGFVSMERSGKQQCVSCGNQGPKVVNVNASGNGDGGGFSITSEVYYWKCSSDCKYEGWGKNGSSCIKCADQGMRVEQGRSQQNVCEFCPDGTGWNNETGACTACMVKLASYNGRCLDWDEFENEINSSCKNNPNIASCNGNPFYINDKNQVVLDTDNYTIQNGRVVWTGSGNDNPHRYYKERLTAGKQAWRPCSNGCCHDGEKKDVKDVTKFTMPGMACTCNGIKCATSVLSCSDVLGKKREDSSTTYENRIKEILSGTGYQYNPTEITLFIRDSVCNSNLKITKFCRDRNNTDSCIDFSNIKWLDVAQPSSKYLYYSTGIEIPPEVSIDTNIGEGSKD